MMARIFRPPLPEIGRKIRLADWRTDPVSGARVEFAKKIVEEKPEKDDFSETPTAVRR
jgi:hypothetical protein